MNEADCVNNITVDSKNCLPPCHGLILTSFTKSESKRNLNSEVVKNLIAYRIYTDWFEYPSALKGPSSVQWRWKMISNQQLIILCLLIFYPD